MVVVVEGGYVWQVDHYSRAIAVEGCYAWVMVVDCDAWPVLVEDCCAWAMVVDDYYYTWVTVAGGCYT